MSRHPNIALFQDAVHAKGKSLGEQLTLLETLLAKLAVHYSEEGWREILALAEKEASLLWHPAGPPKTFTQEYGISLLPKSEKRSKAAGVSA